MTDLEKFRKWMISRGRSPGTAQQYVWCVRQCLAHPDGPTARLVGRKLAPKTKRINKAALRAYCKFIGDGELLLLLDDLKLPPAERVTVKEPLSTKQWQDLARAIAEADISEPERAALAMITDRGFRSGDVVHLTRRQCSVALDQEVLLFRAKGGKQLAWSVDPFADSLRTLVDYNGWEIIADLISPRAAPENRGRAARLRLHRRIRTVAGAAGLDPETVHLHRLRRTYCTEFLEESGGDIVALKDHMGHADIKTSAEYVDHSRRGVLDQVAKKMRKRRARQKP